MDVWFYSRIETAAQRPTRRAEKKKNYTRAPPERVGRALCLLTQTYHGSRVTGHLRTKTHLSGNRVYQMG
jgi:hypothetical protein